MTHSHRTSKSRASSRGICSISQKTVPVADLVNLETIRPKLALRIRQDHPDLPEDALVSREEIERYRELYVSDLLRAESGEISELERQVAESLSGQAMLTENIEASFKEDRSFGERMSDGLALFAGSWTFLLTFALFLALWMAYNLHTSASFDPYPFILLNLVLSTIAAVQAPIIMMSQQRQEAKDRLRALNDYKVNLKAELEIRHLHEKLDHLLGKQWQRLAEIQELQLESMAQNRQ